MSEITVVFPQVPFLRLLTAVVLSMLAVMACALTSQPAYSESSKSSKSDSQSSGASLSAPTTLSSRDAGVSLYGLTARTITGQEQQLSQYKGSVALVVNVASLCGFTEQYRGLQQLYLKFKDRGFVILGFPSNDFGEQEPGSNQEIHNFCTGRFGVTFPLFSKSRITGDKKNVVYEFLTGASNKSEVQWNFEKFLVGRDGKVLRRFASSIEPDSKELLAAIEAAIEAPRSV